MAGGGCGMRVVCLQYEQESGFLDFLTGYSPVIEPRPDGEVFLEIPRQGIRSLVREMGRSGFRVAGGIGTNPFIARAAVPAGMGAGRGRLPGLVRIRTPEGGALFAVPPGSEAEFAAALPVELLWPLPPKTRLALRGLGLVTGADVARVGDAELRAHFGEAGVLAAAYARGLDRRRVQALYPPPEVVWRCVPGGVVDRSALDGWLGAGARNLAGRLWQKGCGYRRLRLEIGLDGGRRLESERRFPAHVPPDAARLRHQLLLLLDAQEVDGPVDELRVTAGMLYRLAPRQLDLFSPETRAADGLERAAALDTRYPGRLARGWDAGFYRRERMLHFYDPCRGRWGAGGAG